MASRLKARGEVRPTSVEEALAPALEAFLAWTVAGLPLEVRVWECQVRPLQLEKLSLEVQSQFAACGELETTFHLVGRLLVDSRFLLVATDSTMPTRGDRLRGSSSVSSRNTSTGSTR